MSPIRPINIHTKNEVLNLAEGSYYVNILGGWSIFSNGFSIKLLSEITKDQVDIKRAKWPVQDFDFGKRSKRYYEFVIKKKGNYILEFVNPTKLKVRGSNVAIFPPFSFFNKEKPNNELSITIVKKNG
jgi:hypothetical protein